MISDNALFATIDLEDFYLGTSLPFPEFNRIPAKFIPHTVITFYKLKPFIQKGALYCTVLKTHYGLPQAGALSQERLFDHLERNGYFQLFHTPSIFPNHNGTVRFSLVVDDFAVVWSNKTDMNHFIQTLRQLYTVKVEWSGGKYLGMTIDINRQERHVTLSMPGYIITKLLRRVRPQGVKSATTPAIYIAPNYKSLAQRELQVVVGTLLYYARSVDSPILTAVHELGSVQSKPTLQSLEDGTTSTVRVLTPELWYQVPRLVHAATNPIRRLILVPY
jgi:hypothetical protein